MGKKSTRKKSEKLVVKEKRKVEIKMQNPRKGERDLTKLRKNQHNFAKLDHTKLEMVQRLRTSRFCDIFGYISTNPNVYYCQYFDYHKRELCTSPINADQPYDLIRRACWNHLKNVHKLDKLDDHTLLHHVNPYMMLSVLRRLRKERKEALIASEKTCENPENEAD